MSQQESRYHGYNAQGNHYVHLGWGEAAGGSYRYDNADGSYAYQNENGSRYYKPADGPGRYTPPSQNPAHPSYGASKKG